MNKIVPGSVKRINKKGGNFVLMENLAAFQNAVKVNKYIYIHLQIPTRSKQQLIINTE